MGKGKWINKKNATTFQLVYRPQNDPLIHDDSAPDMVLAPTQLPNGGSKSTKGSVLSDLASQLGADAERIRDNEGEAANYGVYYDDTEYDYMQHLRDLGQGTGDAVFVEAKQPSNANKGKGRQQKPSLADSLAKLNLQNQSEDLLDEDILPSKNLTKLTYQAQQDVPDAIAGFQPDMDPRLREVLEALEDDAYVDDEGGDDIFQELAKAGDEIDRDEFEEVYDEFDDDDGWESDRTVKASNQKGEDNDDVPQLVDTTREDGAPSDDWMQDFKKFKDDQKAGLKKPTATKGPAAPSEIQSSIWTTTTSGGRKKARKGAMTNPSTYSMTSSSLVRTEQLNILDRRFEKIEEEYGMDDMDDMASVSAVSTMSTVQGPTRQDFDNMLDEFLDEYSLYGKKRVKKGKWKNGIEQFDEIRKELGKPIIPAKYRTSSGAQ